MHVSARILRAEADQLACRPRYLTTREIERQENILDTATILLARHGTHAVTFRLMATALRLAPATLRFHYVDLDDLLGAILQRHLHRLADLLSAVPEAPAETLHARRRQAWHDATRGAFGALNEAHTLLLRDRHMLPPDLRDPIELTYHGLAALLVADPLPEALALIDLPAIAPSGIETLLAGLAPLAPPPRPQEPWPPPPLRKPARKLARPPRQLVC